MKKSLTLIIYILILSISYAQKFPETNTKKVIFTDKAPKPIGPYSQAVVSGDFIFISGQIALDSTTGKIIDGTISDETNQIMQNIQNILNSAGADFRDIVKTSIYLTDLSNFGKVNEIYGGYFNGEYPARETLQVSALPKGARIEISVIAQNPKNKQKRKAKNLVK